MEHRILAFETLTSTSDYLKENLSSLEDGAVVVTSFQSKGRGRKGRSWESSSGDLIFSLLLQDVPSNSFSVLPLLSGVALSLALEDHDVRPSIKWPNDLYFHTKKIAGILCEGVSEGGRQSAIIGIGVNLAPREFSKDIALKAESLGNLGHPIQKEELLPNFLNHFDALWNSSLLGKADWFPLLKNRDFLKNQRVHLNYYGENLRGTAKGIAPSGALLVEKEDGQIIQVTSGEATLSPSSDNNIEKEFTHA